MIFVLLPVLNSVTPPLSSLFLNMCLLFLGVIEKTLYLCNRYNILMRIIMATTTSISNSAQMIITLEDNTLVADIKRISEEGRIYKCIIQKCPRIINCKV